MPSVRVQAFAWPMWLASFVLGCSGDNGTPVTQCAEGDLLIVYADNDNDGYGAPGTAKDVCPPLDSEGRPTDNIPRGFSINDLDCNDFLGAVHPDAIEECDGSDNDCDEAADEGLRTTTFWIDADGDTYGNPDGEKSTETCAAPPGYVENFLDCDDDNAGINIDAIEICDGLDNDCDLLADDADPFLDKTSAPVWYLDQDSDGFGTTFLELALVQCDQPSGNYVLNDDDCDDLDPAISPNGTEVCNHIDDDCDFLIDDSDADIDPTTQITWNADNDLDGFGDPTLTTLACFQPWFYTNNTDDCDDNEPLLGLPAPWVFDTDGDFFGSGDPSADTCTSPGAGWVLLAKGEDCDETSIFVNPSANEICDGKDNDCDDLFDGDDPDVDPNSFHTFYRDADGDFFGDDSDTTEECTKPPGFIDNPDDCDDTDRFVNPDATEVCDEGVDNDCDGDADSDDASVDLSTARMWWFDLDEDGFGDPNQEITACTAPADYVGNDLDCDDTDELQLVDGPWLFDNDGDGVGAGVPSAAQCTAPFPDWVPNFYGIDCDNSDDTRFPGNPEICANGVDEDCDGLDNPCP